MKCCFIGHRDIVGLEEKIYTIIKKLINSGVTEFYSGGMGKFDKLCESTVRDLGGKITLIAYNRNQIKENDQLWYDNIIIPSGDKPYSKLDIPKRNQWLVENSDICLCCVHNPGGAKYTFDYAVAKNKWMINIAL